METNRPTRDSERRQATVIFADISGFTVMSEKTDPEEMTVLMNRCFAMLEEIVHRHGGTVDKYIGDCMMALFGVPESIENAPQRAVNTAIEIRSRLEEFNREHRPQIALGVHIGINSGLVIAGDVGGQVKRDFTVMGDTVNLASRLKDVSRDGQIYVGSDTYRYTRSQFEYRPLKPLSLKGKEQPISAYELLSVKPTVHRPKATPSDRMIFSCLVGRNAELERLSRAISGVIHAEGSIVSLVGEAGIGKSRLIEEMAGLPAVRETTFLEGRSLSIGQNLSFHPFIDLFQHWAGISEDEDEQPSLVKLEAAVADLFPKTGGEIFPFIATLMGMRVSGTHAKRIEGIEGEAMEKMLLKSTRDLLQAMARRSPLVLVFEDLHWADLSSIKLLESLLRLVADHRILFINVMRPDHPETGTRILELARQTYPDQHTEISIERLDDRHCDQLIDNLLQIPDLPYATRKLIAGKAEGNPFYIEEVVRSLIDAKALEYKDGHLRVTEKIVSVVIPGTIQEVIMARVDRLDESTRNLIQVASVIGRSFYYRILAEIMERQARLDDDLSLLKEKQIILERMTRRTGTVRRSLLLGELEYIFKHALAQETIYESLLQRTRRELHLKVARTIEAAFADRLADFYGMLAYHYSRAENTEKAEEYLFKAGEEAVRSAASSEALQYFREASRLYLFMHGDGGDVRKKATLEKNIGLALLNKGSLTESIEYFDNALEFLGEYVPKNAVAVHLSFARNLAAVLYRIYVRRGRGRVSPSTERQREVFDIIHNRARALTTSDPRRLFIDNISGIRRLMRTDPSSIEQAAGFYAGTACLFAFSGISFAMSRRFLEIAKDIVREGDIRNYFVYRTMRFIHHFLEGDWGEAHAVEDALVEQVLRYGQVWEADTYLGLDCDRKTRQGDFAAAAKRLEQLTEIIDAYGYEFGRSTHDGQAAWLLLEERKLDRALQATDRYYATRHEGPLKILALGSRAKMEVLLGGLPAAAATLSKAEEVIKQSGDVAPWHLSAYTVGRLLLDVTALEECTLGRGSGQRAVLRLRARRSAQKAIRVATKVATPRTETYKLVGRLCWLLGKQNQAMKWWTKSVETGEQLGARPELARSYVEVGQRLAERGSRHNALLGIKADDYLERARQLFSQMNLQWDLEQLDAVAGTETARRLRA